MVLKGHQHENPPNLWGGRFLKKTHPMTNSCLLYICIYIYIYIYIGGRRRSAVIQNHLESSSLVGRRSSLNHLPRRFRPNKTCATPERRAVRETDEQQLGSCLPPAWKPLCVCFFVGFNNHLTQRKQIGIRSTHPLNHLTTQPPNH